MHWIAFKQEKFPHQWYSFTNSCHIAFKFTSTHGGLLGFSYYHTFRALKCSTKILFMFSNVKTLDVMLYSKALVCLDKVICFDKSVIHRMQFSDKVKAFYYSQICFLLFLDLHTQKKSTFAANVKCLSNMLNAFQINNWILNLLTAHDMLFREEFKFFLWYLFSRCSCFALSASSQQVRELPKNQRKRQAITVGRKMSSLFSQLHPTPQRFFFISSCQEFPKGSHGCSTEQHS